MSDIEKIRIDGTNYDVADAIARNGLSTFRGVYKDFNAVPTDATKYQSDIFGSTVPTNNDYIVVKDSPGPTYELTVDFSKGGGVITKTSARLSIASKYDSVSASTKSSSKTITLKITNNLYAKGYLSYPDMGSIQFYKDAAFTIPAYVEITDESGSQSVSSYTFVFSGKTIFTYTDPGTYVYIYKGNFTTDSKNGWIPEYKCDYTDITYESFNDKPKINGTELSGDVSLEDIGAASESNLDDTNGRVRDLEIAVDDMKFWHGTLAEYNNISVKDANTLYIIKG